MCGPTCVTVSVQSDIFHRSDTVAEFAEVADGDRCVGDDRNPAEQIFDGLLRRRAIAMPPIPTPASTVVMSNPQLASVNVTARMKRTPFARREIRGSTESDRNARRARKASRNRATTKSRKRPRVPGIERS